MQELVLKFLQIRYPERKHFYHENILYLYLGATKKPIIIEDQVLKSEAFDWLVDNDANAEIVTHTGVYCVLIRGYHDAVHLEVEGDSLLEAIMKAAIEKAGKE